MVRRRKFALVLASVAIAAGSVAIAGCGDDDDSGDSGSTTAAASGGGDLSGTLAGAGATSQQAAQTAWIAGFQTANPGATVSYQPIGSGGGRTQFLDGATAFAGSDSPLDEEEELPQAQKVCGGVDNVVEVPVYVSPIALPFNVDGVTELNLSADTVAKIFAGEIKKWNDPAIAETNPDATLPDQDIVVVARSDESGTTKNFADYLSQVAPDTWTYEVEDTWPVKGGEQAQGTSGVISAVQNGSGTIGYADESQVGSLPVASVGVGGEFVGPTPEAAAAVLDDATRIEGEGANIWAFELNRDTEASGVYPITLVSYGITCIGGSSAHLVGGYFQYMISPDGQSVAAEAAGSAPLSDTLRTQIQPSVDAIAGAASEGTSTGG